MPTRPSGCVLSVAVKVLQPVEPDNTWPFICSSGICSWPGAILLPLCSVQLVAAGSWAALGTLVERSASNNSGSANGCLSAFRSNITSTSPMNMHASPALQFYGLARAGR